MGYEGGGVDVHYSWWQEQGWDKMYSRGLELAEVQAEFGGPLTTPNTANNSKHFSRLDL
jgi:hypothetical protein